MSNSNRIKYILYSNVEKKAHGSNAKPIEPIDCNIIDEIAKRLNEIRKKKW